MHPPQDELKAMFETAGFRRVDISISPAALWLYIAATGWDNPCTFTPGPSDKSAYFGLCVDDF